MPITMRQVAARAGVAASTVSRVLNKTHFIAAETEKRVLDAVETMGYYKNVHAKRLATGQSDLFGLVISEIANPYFPEIIRGFQAAAWDHNFEVLLWNTEYIPERTRSVIERLVQKDVCGIAIITSSIDSMMTPQLVRAGIGIVYCNFCAPGKLVSNITINYERGVLQAIDHVVSLGHRSAAIIAGPETNRTAVNIKQALLSGLESKGITPFPVMSANYRLDAGSSAVGAVLSARKMPTVLFCGSDLIAMGAMSALEDAGVQVPEDISVVGIDDISFSSLARPPLTTISVPRERLGVTAFEALHKMLSSKRKTGANYTLDTELVVRQSTALCRKRKTSGAAVLRQVKTAASR